MTPGWVCAGAAGDHPSRPQSRGVIAQRDDLDMAHQPRERLCRTPASTAGSAGRTATQSPPDARDTPGMRAGFARSETSA